MSEQDKANKDLIQYGQSFMVGGKHVPLDEVILSRSEQDKIAFEKIISNMKWGKKLDIDLRKDGAVYPYKYDLANILFELFQAATLESAERIASLEGEVAELNMRIIMHKKLLDESYDKVKPIVVNNHDLHEALKHADEFISNGIEFGYIRMPDESLKGIDSAHDTPEIIRKALSATPSESLAKHDDKDI